MGDHQLAEQTGTALGKKVQQPDQKGGHEKVLRGADGLEEPGHAVEGTGGKNEKQHVVDERIHHQLIDKQNEQLCIVASEDIAEVAGRDQKPDLIAEIHNLVSKLLDLSGEKVDDSGTSQLSSTDTAEECTTYVWQVRLSSRAR